MMIKNRLWWDDSIVNYDAMINLAFQFGDPIEIDNSLVSFYEGTVYGKLTYELVNHVQECILDGIYSTDFFGYVTNEKHAILGFYLNHTKVIETVAKDHNLEINGWFLFGSMVERKNGQELSYDRTSDIDVIIITDTVEMGTKYSYYNYDIQTITVEHFNTHSDCSDVEVAHVLQRYRNNKNVLNVNTIDQLKTYWFDDTIKLDTVVDIKRLRSAFSKKSSHSFVKAKKKMIDGDIKSFFKSYYHSIRILDLGMRICSDDASYQVHRSKLPPSSKSYILKELHEHNYDGLMELPKPLIELYKSYKRKFKITCPK